VLETDIARLPALLARGEEACGASPQAPVHPRPARVEDDLARSRQPVQLGLF
jgi:hypothetical protein